MISFRRERQEHLMINVISALIGAGGAITAALIIARAASAKRRDSPKGDE